MELESGKVYRLRFTYPEFLEPALEKVVINADIPISVSVLGHRVDIYSITLYYSENILDIDIIPLGTPLTVALIAVTVIIGTIFTFLSLKEIRDMTSQAPAKAAPVLYSIPLAIILGILILVYFLKKQ